jgi:hypothetical protein
MDLDLLTAHYVLGMVASDDLPRIAADLLAAGVDCPSFACLAGGDRLDHPAELRELFEAGLAECALHLPTRVEAATRRKLHLVREIAAGRLDPVDGAAQVVDLYRAIQGELQPSGTYVGEEFGIARLVGLYYGLDDVEPGRRAEVMREIVAECRSIDVRR